MLNYKYLARIDFRLLPVLCALMGVSVLVISSMTGGAEGASIFTTTAKAQVQWCMIGWGIFAVGVVFDYRKLRSWSWVLYVGAVLLLIGLFFTPSIQHVHRWYRVPFTGREFQPSEYTKLVVMIALSTFLEMKGREVGSLKTALQACLIVFIPFFLILKQPDLGTALVLYPTALVMFYIGGIHPGVVRALTIVGAICFAVAALVFSGTISHEALRPYATKVLKEYQYERLNPNTYHQRAAQIAIGLGGFTGSGWLQSEFAGKEWLPAAHTDSVFAAFVEEFGFMGAAVVVFLFFGLIYFSFKVTLRASDLFGRLLAAGIAVYFAMHVIMSIGMMVGFLPISGVPLPFVAYGGSSLFSSMMALGILQSIYSRRFMF